MPSACSTSDSFGAGGESAVVKQPMPRVDEHGNRVPGISKRRRQTASQSRRHQTGSIVGHQHRISGGQARERGTFEALPGTGVNRPADAAIDPHHLLLRGVDAAGEKFAS